MKPFPIIILTIILIVSCSNPKQNLTKKSNFIGIDSVPQLTYNQMLEEHDTLVSYIKQVSPIIYFNKEVRNIDFEEHAKNLRLKINSKTTMPEYLNIVKKTINSAQDNHTSIIWPEMAEIIKKHWLPNGIEIYNYDSTAFNYAKKYDNYFNKTFYTKLNLDLIYTNGNYYTVLPFSFNHKNYPAIMKLISCNDKNVDDVVKGMTQLVTTLKWDRENDKVYFEKFYKSPFIYKNDSLKLVFKDENNKKHALHFSKKDTVSFLEKKTNNFGYNPDIKSFTSHYFKKEKLFYAKIPQMQIQLADSLNKRFEKVIKNNKVNTIVLDIRGNGGGDDRTYSKFLSKVIKKPLQLNVKLGRNYSSVNNTFYKLNKDSILKRDNYSFFVDSVAKLTKPKMFYIKLKNYTFASPDSTQYNFNGNIYILQDRFIYSSSSNLSNLAYKSKQLISVGENPNLLGGLQTSVMALCLPYSKVLLRIEPQIDFTNTKVKADIFQNNVEHFVKYPIDFIYEKTTTNKDVFGKEFLYNKDPMFKKVLELEKD